MGYSRKSFIKKVGIGGLSAFSGLPFLAASYSMPQIKPKGLSTGDTIGMISPASSLPEEDEYQKVVQKIEGLGFKVKVGPHAKEHYGYLAGSDRHRADDLNIMFADPDVDAIIPFRGGWGCNRILELINYDLIHNHPKPLIGYSDITSLLLAIHAKTGLITYHGPVGTSNWEGFTLSYFKKALMEGRPFTMRNSKSATRGSDPMIKTITPGEATGKLLGGNLTVLTAMMGSDFLPSWEGAILFVEDVGEDIYRIDRMITQLKLNGVLDKINGFIFGQCTRCSEGDGFHFTLEEIVKDHIKEQNIPAFIGASIGHVEDLFTLPIGLQAKINADSGTITLLESPTAI